MVRQLVAVALLLPVTFSSVHSQTQTEANRIFSAAFERKLVGKDMGQIIKFVGEKFIGKPYEANTLEIGDSERLICRLSSFDCVTLVENVLALARCIKGNRLSFETYRHELQTIRYRHGIIGGYASRLHYFSDWIHDNQSKAIVRDVTKELGGIPYTKEINFMSAHRRLYPRLAKDSIYQQILAQEDSLRTHEIYYIPKARVRAAVTRIRAGDLIAITTTAEGLDISHTGIAVWGGDGKLHLLHAPDKGLDVTITDEPFAEYLAKHASQEGIMVVRALPPEE